MSTAELLLAAPKVQMEALIEPATLAPDPSFSTMQPLPPECPEMASLHPMMLPESIRPWLVEAAERSCLPLEMLAVPAIVGLSGLIGRSVYIKPREYSDWTVWPNLWGAVVASPGAKKSDAMMEALKPLQRLEKMALAEHQAAMQEAKAELAIRKAQLAGELAKAKRGKSSKDEIADIQRQIEGVEFLAARRYMTQDATAEKLGELLRSNPSGIVLVRDELASWIASMERQENSMARGFFLASWNGNTPYTFDRIGRGTISIPATCVAVIGCIQPQPLKAVFERLRSDPSRADGMVQRFQLLVWPDGLPDWNPPNSWPSHQAREQAFHVFAELGRLRDMDADGGEQKSRMIRFASDAGAAFMDWNDGHERRLRDPKMELSPCFASHLAKYGSLVPSLAVVFHLADVAAAQLPAIITGDLPPVGLDSFNRALDWAEFLEGHARKVYGFELNQGALAAHSLARKIKDGSVTDGMTVRDIRRLSRDLARNERLHEALPLLQEKGWLQVVQRPSGIEGGRPSEIVRLHPDLRGKP